MSQQGWESKGRIRLEADGRLTPPILPDEAGLYRFQFDEATVYIGEAGDIQRRIGDYLLYYPSVGIESEFRIYNALMKHKGADVSILVGKEFASRSQRCVREHQEINDAKANYPHVLNGGSLEERIAFLRAEIQRFETKLEAQKAAEGKTS